MTKVWKILSYLFVFFASVGLLANLFITYKSIEERVSLGATSSQIIKSDIGLYQHEYKSVTGKFKTIVPTVGKSGIIYRVEEYVAPSGPGYQAYVQYPDGSSESFGEGPEAVR